ncbi:hypothetical protein L1887_50338 [Cichorium endivia]|nr:hypothetical protein L1887_50338 [Cichorium endivia]
MQHRDAGSLLLRRLTRSSSCPTLSGASVCGSASPTFIRRGSKAKGNISDQRNLRQVGGKTFSTAKPTRQVEPSVAAQFQVARDLGVGSSAGLDQHSLGGAASILSCRLSPTKRLPPRIRHLAALRLRAGYTDCQLTFPASNANPSQQQSELEKIHAPFYVRPCWPAGFADAAHKAS